MISLKFYWKLLGGHVHVRVFSGKDVHLTHGKNGDLVFDEREWPDAYEALTRIGIVREDA